MSLRANRAIKSLMVLPSEVSTNVGGQTQFSAIAINANGTSDDVTTQAIWVSSDVAVAEVDANGLATAVDDGAALISATYQGFVAGADLLVNVTGVALVITPTSLQLAPGRTARMAATGTFSDGSSMDVTAALPWETSDPAIAQVDSTGLVTAVSAGTAVIAAHTNTLAAAASVTVLDVGVSPCDQLKLAQQQLYLLAAGKSTVAVETPQLGRVEFNRATMGDLQRLVDQLTAQCAAAQGLPVVRRRPISMEAIP